MSRLVLQNLTKDANEETLRDVLGKKGFVTDINVELVFMKNGEFQHIAFIDFKTEEESERALIFFKNIFQHFSPMKVELCTKPDENKQTCQKFMCTPDSPETTKESNYEDQLNQQKNKEIENHNHNSKEEENGIQIPEEILDQRQENQNNRMQHETVEVVISKFPFVKVKTIRSRNKKKKRLMKDNYNEAINNVQPSIVEANEPVLNTQENKEIENYNHNSKEEESSIQILEELPHQSQETQNNGVHLETFEVFPKLPSYLEKLPYAEGQWSATNPTGEKKYSKQFLLQLKNEAVCQKKHDLLRNWNDITNICNSSQCSLLKGIPNLRRSQKAEATGYNPLHFKPGYSEHGVNDSNGSKVQNIKNLQQNYIIGQSKLQSSLVFKESLSVTTTSSSKMLFSNQTKNSNAFTSSTTFPSQNDSKNSSSTSQIMYSEYMSRTPLISESKKRQRIMTDIASTMPQFAQDLPLLDPTLVPNEAVVESLVELDPEVANRINLQCENIIQEYENFHNLDDIIYTLVQDHKSEVRTKHTNFVHSLVLITLARKPNSHTEVGNMLAELLSKNVISMVAITKGIDSVVKEWNDLLVDFPLFFSYIASITAPLLKSKFASFIVNNSNDDGMSIRPWNSYDFFPEVLEQVHTFKESQNIKEKLKENGSFNLDKVTSKNVVSLTERFKELPIGTIDRLEEIIDLFFEKTSSTKLDSYYKECNLGIDDDEYIYTKETNDDYNVSKNIPDENLTNKSNIPIRGSTTKMLLIDKVIKNSIDVSLKKEVTGTENGFDDFCNNLAVKLKSMPFDRAIICQKELQKIMENEHL